MTTLVTAYPLPWRLTDEERRRALLMQLGAVALVLVCGIVIPLIDLPQRIREVRDAVTMTRITLTPPAPKPIVPPPPPKVVPVKQAQIAPRAVANVPLPRTAVQPRPSPPQPTASDRAADASVAALDDAFADLRQPDARNLRAASTASASTIGPARADRALLGANQGRRAMALDAAPGKVGNVALAGRSETRVNAPPAGRAGGASSTAGNGQPPGRQRSSEEVRRVFDANKGGLYALYQSALVQSPGLSGKIVLELVIAPDGTVQRVRVLSSEIDQPNLVEQVAQRVRSFHFAAKDVDTTTVTYPVHFLPS